MRFYPIIIILLILNTMSFSQEITVNKIQTITNQNDGSFFYPQFSPNGTELYFTSGNQQGLWKYNLNNKILNQINDYYGAGFSPFFTIDGLNLVFRKDEYKNRRKYSSIIAMNLETQIEEVLEKSNRNLTSPQKTTTGDIVYKKKSVVNAYLQDISRKINAPTGKFLYSENGKLVLFDDANRIELESLGTGQFLWISLSPDQSKILFTRAGQGTFISDLNGNIITDIGYANAPVWSPNGKWIVYMDDKDNGYYYTASEIFIASTDGTKKYQITNSEYEIEMYPQWTPDSKRITYHTINGIIKIAYLEVQ